MDNRKIIAGIILFTVLLLVAGVVLLSDRGPTAATITASQNAKATIDQRNYDWGRIDMKNGNVSKTFTVKNTGTDILKLAKIKTSCHCTKAQVKINNISSPYFGMNSVSSWIGEVPPGQEAQLEVIFDPAYHGPRGVGPINRLVAVETNDKNNSRIEFSLTATVFR